MQKSQQRIDNNPQKEIKTRFHKIFSTTSTLNPLEIYNRENYEITNPFPCHISFP